MNTRLQVEHPVTEAITGLDLVEWQLRVARGEHLPLKQDQVKLSGHAIEVRLYAEDADAGFLPQTGRIGVWRPPSGPGVRIDHGMKEGLAISPFYDPMIAKLIAHGATREQARTRLVQALRDTVVLPPTNRHFRHLLSTPNSRRRADRLHRRWFSFPPRSAIGIFWPRVPACDNPPSAIRLICVAGAIPTPSRRPSSSPSARSSA
jgi:acetyl/propionyl-CoA carboxylase alpha subunit